VALFVFSLLKAACY